MWVLGPTEVALKLPVLLMNVAVGLLIVWRAHRDLGLSPWLAAVGALPVAVPPLVLGTRFMEAMGGNVEPLLYALVLWSVRARPWIFGLVLGVAVAQREFAVYPAMALVALEAAYGRWPARQALRRWALVAALVVTVAVVIAIVRPYGSMFGPGTVAREMDHELSGQRIVAARLCVVPSTWSARSVQLFGEHLPIMVGGVPGPMQLAGVSSGMGQGNPGLWPWVAALILAGVACGVSAARSRPEPGDGVHPVPPSALPWFLLLSGVISTTVFVYVSCNPITLNTLRYNLLVAFVPVGALLAGLGHPATVVRAGLVTATLLWVRLSASDYQALAREVLQGGWPDYRADLIDVLESRHLRTLWGDYRLAYLVSFKSRERIVVAPIDAHRIDAYAAAATAAHARFLKYGECANGELLVPGIWLCPPRAP